MTGRFDGRTETSQTCQYKVYENTLALRCSSATTIFTYMGNENNNILVNNNTDDITLTFRTLPQWVINALLDKYGSNNPFTLGVSVVGESSSNSPMFIAHGMMYGIIVQAPQDSTPNGYLKLIPYWTDGAKFQSLRVLDDANQPVWIDILEKQAINENGLFGTDWIMSGLYSEEMWTGKISPFCVEIPLW